MAAYLREHPQIGWSVLYRSAMPPVGTTASVCACKQNGIPHQKRGKPSVVERQQLTSTYFSMRSQSPGILSGHLSWTGTLQVKRAKRCR